VRGGQLFYKLHRSLYALDPSIGTSAALDGYTKGVQQVCQAVTRLVYP
jgi:hypothetical protein